MYSEYLSIPNKHVYLIGVHFRQVFSVLFKPIYLFYRYIYSNNIISIEDESFPPEIRRMWVYYLYLIWCIVFNTTLSNISVISWATSFIGGGNQSTWRKPPTCRKSLTNFIPMLYPVHFAMNRVQTNNFSGDRHWLHR